MAEEQKQDKMQEAIDGQLSDEMSRQLFDTLARDPAAAGQYDRLQRVDALFKRASHRRAPARLAATIMARLAKHVEAETQLDDLPPETQKALMLSLSASMLAMMPLMEAAAWLVLHAQRDPELLGEVMIRTVGWMTLVTDALILLLEDAENLARSQPEVATAALALTPYMLVSLLDYLDETLTSESLLSQTEA